MSQPPPNTSLSLSTRLLTYLGPPSIILLTAFISPKTALLSPLAIAPSAYFLQKWRQENPSRRGKLEPLLWIFASAGTLGLTTVALLQILICKSFSAIIFHSNPILAEEFWDEFARTSLDGLTSTQLIRRAELASSWQNWAFNGVLMFVAAGLVEEVLKYLPIMYAAHRSRKDGQTRDRAYLDYALAGALSFGFVESMGFLYGSRNETWSIFVLTMFERLVLSQVGHLSVAALTAFRAIRRDFYGEKMGFWGVIWPAVLFHGTFDFVAISASALEGNVGWIHPKGKGVLSVLFGMAFGMVGTVLWQVRKEWRALKERDASGKKSDGN